MRALALLLVVLSSTFVSAQGRFVTAEQRTQLHGPSSQGVEPFRIVGNIYYVGAQNIASYLMTSPEGHILIDTGTKEMGPVVLGNIEKLGFKPGDIKIMLSSHAHFDHIQGHAAMKKATGARVMALGDDARALASGKDLSPVEDEGWDPVRVDRVLKDGDTVTLGGTTLKAVWTPGHTPGCTTWVTDVQDKGKSYSVVFLGGIGPNQGPQLVGNPKHPRLIEDTLGSIRKLRGLNPDISLGGHPQQAFAGKVERIKSGGTPHPLMMQPGAWTKMLDNAEANFRKRVEAEKAKTA